MNSQTDPSPSADAARSEEMDRAYEARYGTYPDDYRWAVYRAGYRDGLAARARQAEAEAEPAVAFRRRLDTLFEARDSGELSGLEREELELLVRGWVLATREYVRLQAMERASRLVVEGRLCDHPDHMSPEECLAEALGAAGPAPGQPRAGAGEAG